jgi:FtsZ-interacting cell division protein ZipA
LDIAPWVWVVIGLVVVVLLVVFLVTGRRRRAMEQKRDEANREKAAEIRRKAEEVELDAREREARASRARADAEQAQVQAARLKQEAEQKAGDARSLREEVATHTEKANAIDPDVRTEGASRGREGMGRDVHRDARPDQDADLGRGQGAVGRDAPPVDRREVPGAAGSDTRQEHLLENAGEAQRGEGAERVQAEDLRRRRERTDGDTRSGI